MLALLDSPTSHWPSFLAKCSDGKQHSCPKGFPPAVSLIGLNPNDKVTILEKVGYKAYVQEGEVKALTADRVKIHIGSRELTFTLEGNYCGTQQIRILR